MAAAASEQIAAQAQKCPSGALTSVGKEEPKA